MRNLVVEIDIDVQSTSVATVATSSCIPSPSLSPMTMRNLQLAGRCDANEPQRLARRDWVTLLQV